MAVMEPAIPYQRLRLRTLRAADEDVDFGLEVLGLDAFTGLDADDESLDPRFGLTAREEREERGDGLSTLVESAAAAASASASSRASRRARSSASEGTQSFSSNVSSLCWMLS